MLPNTHSIPAHLHCSIIFPRIMIKLSVKCAHGFFEVHLTQNHSRR